MGTLPTPLRPDKKEGGVEPVVLLLFIGMIVFTIALFCCEIFFKNDGQMFQVIAGLLTGFSGAFFMRIKPRSGSTTQDPNAEKEPGQ